MYKTMEVVGYTTNLNWWIMSSINRIIPSTLEFGDSGTSLHPSMHHQTWVYLNFFPAILRMKFRNPFRSNMKSRYFIYVTGVILQKSHQKWLKKPTFIICSCFSFSLKLWAPFCWPLWQNQAPFCWGGRKSRCQRREESFWPKVRQLRWRWLRRRLCSWRGRRAP